MEVLNHIIQQIRYFFYFLIKKRLLVLNLI